MTLSEATTHLGLFAKTDLFSGKTEEAIKVALRELTEPTTISWKEHAKQQIAVGNAHHAVLSKLSTELAERTKERDEAILARDEARKALRDEDDLSYVKGQLHAIREERDQLRTRAQLYPNLVLYRRDLKGFRWRETITLDCLDLTHEQIAHAETIVFIDTDGTAKVLKSRQPFNAL